MTAECPDCADRPATVEEARAAGLDPNACRYRPRTPRVLYPGSDRCPADYFAYQYRGRAVR